MNLYHYGTLMLNVKQLKDLLTNSQHTNLNALRNTDSLMNLYHYGTLMLNVKQLKDLLTNSQHTNLNALRNTDFLMNLYHYGALMLNVKQPKDPLTERQRSISTTDSRITTLSTATHYHEILPLTSSNSKAL